MALLCLHDSSRKSLLSKSALPPVSAASEYIVSCDCWNLSVVACAAIPLYMPALPELACVASPSGALATSPAHPPARK